MLRQGGAKLERNEVSRHEVLVYLALASKRDSWLSNQEIADATSVALRTVRAHTKRLVSLGLIDQAEVFPAHRFRWAEKGAKRNASYALRLDAAAQVFGLK